MVLKLCEERGICTEDVECNLRGDTMIKFVCNTHISLCKLVLNCTLCLTATANYSPHLFDYAG